jgi:hypothetical protein
MAQLSSRARARMRTLTLKAHIFHELS